MNRIAQGIQHLKSSPVKPLPEVNEALGKLNSAPLNNHTTLYSSAETLRNRL